MNLTELDFRVADFSAMNAITTSLGELTDGFYPTPVIADAPNHHATIDLR